MERLEGGCVGCFGGMIARNGDIDNTSGGNVVGEKNRGELNLDLVFVNIAVKASNPLAFIVYVYGKHGGLCFVSHATRGEIQLTRRLSWVRRTATPASTLPTVKETSMVVEKLDLIKLGGEGSLRGDGGKNEVDFPVDSARSTLARLVIGAEHGSSTAILRE